MRTITRRGFLGFLGGVVLAPRAAQRLTVDRRPPIIVDEMHAKKRDAVARRVYRSVGDGPFVLVGEIRDCAVNSYTDDVPVVGGRWIGPVTIAGDWA